MYRIVYSILVLLQFYYAVDINILIYLNVESDTNHMATTMQSMKT